MREKCYGNASPSASKSTSKLLLYSAVGFAVNRVEGPLRVADGDGIHNLFFCE